MSVYVDELHDVPGSAKWRYKKACHLLADTKSELHLFANTIGLKIAWFQNKNIPHYDLTGNMRQKAVAKGAIEVDRKRLLEIVKRIRK